MANKSGAIGTKSETASVRAIKARGFPDAERKRPTGRYDCGDLTGTPGICWQVKGGKAAAKASDNQILEWLAATEEQRVNAGADIGVLVVKRAGISDANAHMWWSIVPQWTLAYLHAAARGELVDAKSFALAASNPANSWMRLPVRLYLGDMCALLVAAGYGDPAAVAA